MKTVIIVGYETSHMWRRSTKRVDFADQAEAEAMFARVQPGSVVPGGIIAWSQLLASDEADLVEDELGQSAAETEAEYAWLTAAESGNFYDDPRGD